MNEKHNGITSSDHDVVTSSCQEGMDAPGSPKHFLGWFQRHLSVQLLAGIMLVTAAVLGVAGWQQYLKQAKDAEDILQRDTEVAVSVLAASLAVPIYNYDLPAAEAICRAVLERPEVVSIVIEEPRQAGLILIKRQDRTIQRGTVAEATLADLAVSRSILHRGEQMGVVRLGVTRQYLKEALRATLIYNWLQLAVLELLLVLPIMLFLHLRFVLPVKSLELFTKAIVNGDLEHSGPTLGAGELGALARATVQMRDSIKEKIEALQHEISERKAAEEELRRFEKAVESSADAIGMSTAAGRHYYQNEAFDDLFGEVGETPSATLYVDEAVGREVFNAIMSGAEWTGEVKMHGKSGETLDIMLRAYSIKDKRGTVIGLVGVHTDITGQKKLEEQLLQSQKLESVGRLAGGVAHDFNNMLAVILGNVEMIMDGMDPGLPLYADLMEIRKAGKRSADLTAQLLAFARKQTVVPQVVDLNETVEGMLNMLHRLIGEDIDMVWSPGEKIWPVKIDPAQVDQIMANLCVNARDAIANVGRVTIETGNIVFSEEYCQERVGVVPGEYALLTVSDNGCGMDAETRKNIFEPFFTTKKSGQGTGLGLSTVYGVVKQNNGFINVYSEPGQGTTFRIYLPRHAGKGAEAKEPKPQVVEPGSETILLVEDEPAILKMTKRMLEGAGYKVFAAGTPQEAIVIAREHAGEIHLLMTDVVMPEMNGLDLAKKLLGIYPDLKCLFMSGFTENVIAHHGILDEGVYFIQKPFLIEDLAIKLREALKG